MTMKTYEDEPNISTVCLVTMERPAPIRGTWVMLRIGRKAVQSHKREEPVYEENKIVGLDVHAETIAVAVAEQDGEIRSLGMIPNREEAVGKLVKKLGPVEQLRFCYEAGPTGYVLYWQLTKMGAACSVVARTLVAVKA